MGKIVKYHLKGKTCSKLANGLNFYDLKKTFTPGFALPWGYIHVCYHSSQQVYLFISQVSGERLQDHWSSGSFLALKFNIFHRNILFKCING